MDKFASTAGRPLLSKCLNLVFASRSDSTGTACIEAMGAILGLKDATNMYKQLYGCVDAFLMAPGDMNAYFDECLPGAGAEVRQLLLQFMNERADTWREASAMSRVSLPRYVDMDWSIHVRKASAESSNIGTPAVLMELQVENQPSLMDEIPRLDRVGIELTREKLETVLDGFYRIREQLSSVTGGK